ncbi:hypothetical protein CTI12_AA403800 [Artemisia annua]|uniref:Late embryogenesis abundant protein (LEA) family protein n=1 Tax=Artemisia annua TaxID=35608 RepID=A0A2U1M8Y4_ARTAN|nr:hypothetical protein CTI12_AA403800 [Artemisia annua]
MDSQKAQYNAGQISGQTREKASNILEKADNKVQSAKDNLQEGGQQMMAKAQGAEGAKDAIGANK